LLILWRAKKAARRSQKRNPGWRHARRKAQVKERPREQFRAGAVVILGAAMIDSSRKAHRFRSTGK